MSGEAQGGGGIGFFGLLGVLFIGLKLTGHIGWSWWWVLAPLWAPPALVLSLLGLASAVLWPAALGGRR